MALCKLLGTRTAYHPQANGQVERFNRTLEAILSKVVSENQKDWDSHIPKRFLHITLHSTNQVDILRFI